MKNVFDKKNLENLYNKILKENYYRSDEYFDSNMKKDPKPSSNFNFSIEDEISTFYDGVEYFLEALCSVDIIYNSSTGDGWNNPREEEYFEWDNLEILNKKILYLDESTGEYIALTINNIDPEKYKLINKILLDSLKDYVNNSKEFEKRFQAFIEKNK